MITKKMTNDSRSFGDMLRDLRKGRGVNLGDMADSLKVAASYLSDVELGRRHPFKVEMIEKIGSILDLNEAQVKALIASASVSRGGFELPIDAHNQAAIDAGAALMREWPNFSPDSYRQLQELAERLASEKKKTK